MRPGLREERVKVCVCEGEKQEVGNKREDVCVREERGKWGGGGARTCTEGRSHD